MKNSARTHTQTPKMRVSPLIRLLKSPSPEGLTFADLGLPELEAELPAKEKREAFKAAAICPLISFKMTQENTDPRKSPAAPQYIVYSLPNIQQLLVRLAVAGGGVSKSRIRFLVTAEKQLYFAFEGFPNSLIPRHAHMVANNALYTTCVAAGNLCLIRNKDDSYSIEKINHKSGDFQPGYDSMKWALAILLTHGNLLPPGFIPSNIELEELTQAGGHLATWSVSTDELMQELRHHIALVKDIIPVKTNRYAGEQKVKRESLFLNDISEAGKASSSGLFSPPKKQRTGSLHSKQSSSVFKNLFEDFDDEEMLPGEPSFDSPVKFKIPPLEACLSPS